MHLFSALTPSDIEDFLQPALKQAVALQNAFDKLPPEKRSNTRVPFVTVSAFSSIRELVCKDDPTHIHQKAFLAQMLML